MAIDRENQDFENAYFSAEIIFNEEAYTLGADKIKEMYFFEDIYSFCKTGFISFYDDIGLMEFGPITGNEKIKISYGVSSEKEYTFYIVKIPNIESSNSGSNDNENSIIEIYFADSLYYLLNIKEYSTSYTNVKHSDIVKSICNNMLTIDDFENFEESNETLENFYIPYWTPRKTLKYLIKRCSGSNSGNAGYVFFRNTQEKEYNFITIDSLFSNTELMKITNEDEGIYSFYSNKVFNLNRILHWEINLIDMLAIKNLSGEHKLGYSFEKKSFLEEEYDYTSSINKFTLLGKKSLFPDISNSNSQFNLEGSTNETELENLYYDEWIKRYSIQNVVTIYVQGHEERYAGGIIEIKWPSKDKETEFYNKNLDGKYLIKSITHHFDNKSKPAYTQKIILMKNAYSDSDNTELLKATNTNL